MTTIEIFTDGGCWGNPGPGGWGVVLRHGSKEKTLLGHEAYTTNNRMEMMAAIEGLKILKRPCNVVITTDSAYLKNGITQWLAGWKRNGWRTKDKSLVKNIDLWKQLDDLVNRHQVEWAWIKGHSGHRENEMADELSQKAIINFFQTQNIPLPETKYR